MNASPMITGERTALRPVTSDDLALLASWFADPSFVRWWGGVPKSRDEVEREYLGRHDGQEIVQSFIVLHDEIPIATSRPGTTSR